MEADVGFPAKLNGEGIGNQGKVCRTPLTPKVKTDNATSNPGNGLPQKSRALVHVGQIRPRTNRKQRPKDRDLSAQGIEYSRRTFDILDVVFRERCSDDVSHTWPPSRLCDVGSKYHFDLRRLGRGGANTISSPSFDRIGECHVHRVKQGRRRMRLLHPQSVILEVELVVSHSASCAVLLTNCFTVPWFHSFWHSGLSMEERITLPSWSMALTSLRICSII
jgi:hypothetical protein